jgi:hypothetical protein
VVFRAVNIKNILFWDMMQDTLVHTEVQGETTASVFKVERDSLLKIEKRGLLKALETLPTTWRHIPENQ